MNTIPKIDIVVTRHPHLVTVLRERGIVSADTPVLTHVERPEQVAGLHVAGVLPHHLSCRAASVTEIPMRWSQADREAMSRGDLGLDETRRAAGDPITYMVQTVGRGGVDPARPRWLAWAAALRDVEVGGDHFGAGPHVTPGPEVRGLTTLIVYDATQQCSAQIIPSRGVWRSGGSGPWLDGYGSEVAEADIEPASGWIAEANR